MWHQLMCVSKSPLATQLAMPKCPLCQVLIQGLVMFTKVTKHQSYHQCYVYNKKFCHVNQTISLIINAIFITKDLVISTNRQCAPCHSSHYNTSPIKVPHQLSCIPTSYLPSAQSPASCQYMQAHCASIPNHLLTMITPQSFQGTHFS